MLIQSTFTDFIDDKTAVRIFEHNGRLKPNTLNTQLLFRCVLRTLTFCNKGFLNDTREFDQYIAYGTIRGNMQQIHPRRRTELEVVKTAEKILLNPVLKN